LGGIGGTVADIGKFLKKKRVYIGFIFLYQFYQFIYLAKLVLDSYLSEQKKEMFPFPF
jgi:hypothetical protein